MIAANKIESIAQVFAILSDPTRLHILRVLMTSPKSVGEIVSALKLKQANVSKQLGVLRRAGLVSGTRTANVITYRISSPLVRTLCRTVCEAKPTRRQ